jgi:hypothetical protein
MGHRNSLRVRNREPETLTVIVEPWANEYQLAMGEECTIVALNTSTMPTFEIVPHDGDLTVSVNESDSTFELWRAGVRVEDMTVPIPSWPPQEL